VNAIAPSWWMSLRSTFEASRSLSREVAVHRELGRVHLMAHRAHRAVGALGLQQVLDQPARGVDPGVATLLDQIAGNFRLVAGFAIKDR